MGVIESKMKNNKIKQTLDFKDKNNKNNNNNFSNKKNYEIYKKDEYLTNNKNNNCDNLYDVRSNNNTIIKKNNLKNKIVGVLTDRKIQKNKITNNSGHKSNHGNNKEGEEAKEKWSSLPKSTHSTINRVVRSCDYHVVEFMVEIDDKNSIMTEKPSVLKYKTPHFRAKASVLVPELEEGKQLVIGWIQVVNKMVFINKYSDLGISSWELPELTTGLQKMISDSDGHRYPWYGSKKEVSVLKGPTTGQSMITVLMSDNFSPQVTWFVPAPNHRKTSKEPRLTRVFRDQVFTACLAVMKVPLDMESPIPPINPSSPWNVLSVLRAIKWKLKVKIDIDPSKEVGHRTITNKGQSPYMTSHLIITEADQLSQTLDLTALHPPNANKSQALIWRPFTLSKCSSSSSSKFYSFLTSPSSPSSSLQLKKSIKFSQSMENLCSSNLLKQKKSQSHDTLLDLANLYKKSKPNTSAPESDNNKNSFNKHKKSPSSVLTNMSNIPPKVATIIVQPYFTNVNMEKYTSNTKKYNEFLFNNVADKK